MTTSPLGPVMTSVDGVSLTDEERERLRSPVIGGVVLFAHNCIEPDQIRQLSEEIHALRDPPLLIAVDQEGGRVQRIKNGVTELPPANVYGQIYDINVDKGCDAAELGAMLMAKEVLSTGIDISFSPVLDVMTCESKVIGNRAFHSDPNAVAEIGESWVRGMQRTGMKSVGKHFPGHGGVAEDSHFDTPEDERLIHDVLALDLVPYRRIGSRLDSVMTAHVAYPNITSAVPTYSSFWIEHVLREVLAFYGPVFSDDLTMKGAEDAGEPGARVLTALSSGCDISLICQDSQMTDKAIEEMMDNRESWKDKTWLIDKLRPIVPDEDFSVEQCRDELFELIESVDVST